MSFIGRVKWFNNKAGYGFITITDGQRSGEDIFVHHSGINVDSEQFKYLVQGEYVEFHISATAEGAKHPTQATSVTGVKGGKLMCQTRNDNRKEKKVVATPATTSATTTSTSEFQQPKGRRTKSYAKAVNPSAPANVNASAPAKAGRKFKDGETQTRGKKNAGKSNAKAKPTVTNA
jgi:CspA family cold shock protein